MFTDIHHHISYDMYLSSHTRGIPKKSGPSDQFRTYSGPLLALRSGSGPSPEFRTLVVPLLVVVDPRSETGMSFKKQNMEEFLVQISRKEMTATLSKSTATLAHGDHGRNAV